MHELHWHHCLVVLNKYTLVMKEVNKSTINLLFPNLFTIIMKLSHFTKMSYRLRLSYTGWKKSRVMQISPTQESYSSYCLIRHFELSATLTVGVKLCTHWYRSYRSWSVSSRLSMCFFTLSSALKFSANFFPHSVSDMMSGMAFSASCMAVYSHISARPIYIKPSYNYTESPLVGVLEHSR